MSALPTKTHISEKETSLQNVLLEIAELFTRGAEGEIQFPLLHASISKLMHVPNFMVAVYYPEMEEFCIQYMYDEKDQDLTGKRFPMGSGMTSYVVRQASAQLIDQARLQDLISKDEVKVLGNQGMVSWMGAPLIIAGQIYGVIIIQSYDPAVVYNDTDLNVLAFVAHHVALSLARIKANQELQLCRTQLEQTQHQLTQTRSALKGAKAQVRQLEPTASLGKLVGAIAKEIEIPLTASIKDSEKLQSAILTAHIHPDIESISAIETEFRKVQTDCIRSYQLMQSFKIIADHQQIDKIQEFELRPCIEEVLAEFQVRLDERSIRTHIDCEKSLTLVNNRSAIQLILNHMLQNTLLHAGNEDSALQIEISAFRDQNQIVLEYSDDGCGLKPEHFSKLFSAFFTTRRLQGANGMGSHIIYHLCTHGLNGNIKASNEAGSGLQYYLRFPQKRKLLDENAPQKTEGEINKN